MSYFTTLLCLMAGACFIVYKFIKMKLWRVKINIILVTIFFGFLFHNTILDIPYYFSGIYSQDWNGLTAEYVRFGRVSRYVIYNREGQSYNISYFSDFTRDVAIQSGICMVEYLPNSRQPMKIYAKKSNIIGRNMVYLEASYREKIINGETYFIVFSNNQSMLIEMAIGVACAVVAGLFRLFWVMGTRESNQNY